MINAQKWEPNLKTDMFVFLRLAPRCHVPGSELTLIMEGTEPSAQLSVGSDSVEKPSSKCSKHLQKTSRKENEAVVTSKGFTTARNAQVPHTSYSADLDALQQHQRKTQLRLNPISSARVVFLFVAAVSRKIRRNIPVTLLEGRGKFIFVCLLSEDMAKLSLQIIF